MEEFLENSSERQRKLKFSVFTYYEHFGISNMSERQRKCYIKSLEYQIGANVSEKLQLEVYFVKLSSLKKHSYKYYTESSANNPITQHFNIPKKT